MVSSTVSHGNPWFGMGRPVFCHGKKYNIEEDLERGAPGANIYTEYHTTSNYQLHGVPWASVDVPWNGQISVGHPLTSVLLWPL